jgi:hypothetical protein
MTGAKREPRCDRCDLPESMCTCAKQAAVDRAERQWANTEVVVTAEFPGTCTTCDGPIVPGQRIARRGESRWRHADNTEDCA